MAVQLNSMQAIPFLYWDTYLLGQQPKHQNLMLHKKEMMLKELLILHSLNLHSLECMLQVQLLVQTIHTPITTSNGIGQTFDI